MEYHCRVIDQDGKLRSTIINAMSEEAARMALGYESMHPVLITNKETMTKLFNDKVDNSIKELRKLNKHISNEDITGIVMLIASGSISDLTVN